MYFATTAIATLFNFTQDGALTAIAVVGIALFAGGESTCGRAVVQSAGFGFRLKVRPLPSCMHAGADDPEGRVQPAPFDRSDLKQRACECCGALSDEYRQLLSDRVAA